MKKDIKIVCIIKIIYVGQSNNSEKEYKINRKWVPNKGIYIEILLEYAIEVKRIIKKILVLEHWFKQHGAPVKFIPK